MRPFRSVITGVGCALPKRQVTNAELSVEIQLHGGEPTTDEWMIRRTGIASRHVVSDGETAATLGAQAARAALDHAGITPADVDEIIVATCTPDYRTPSAACLIHRQLGCRRDIPAGDYNGACCGFIMALDHADALAVHRGRRVLVIGAEVLSSITDPGYRDIRTLMGDGAGAVVVEPRADSPNGLLGFRLGTDSAGADLIKVPAGGSALPAATAGLGPKLLYLHMDGRAVYRFATRIIAEVVNALCRDAGVTPADIDLLVPHQANWRIIEAAATALHFPLDRISATIRTCGNTSAASIPIGLADAVASGKLTPGKLVVIVGFGAGLTWGGAILRWGS